MSDDVRAETLAVPPEFRAVGDAIAALTFHSTRPILVTASADPATKFCYRESGSSTRAAAAGLQKN